MTTKAVFLRQKDLRDHLAAVAHSEWFAQALAFVLAELMESRLNADEMAGAKKFKDVLLTLADDEPVEVPYPDAKMNHDLTPTKPADKKKK